MLDRRTFILKALAATTAATAPRWAGAFVHPLDEPAMASKLAAMSPLLAVTSAGARFVAVGQRGQAVLSDDGGRTWVQAAVPVSSDLVALSFANEKSGWAVGHGGVVLRSTDGGATWAKQFDGRLAAQATVDYYGRRAGQSAAIERLLAEERQLAESAGPQPFLDVYFANEREGWVVGTFNRIFRTEDGGQSWLPWMDRTDNPKGLHFNAIAGRGGNVFLAGEQGTVWRLDTTSGRFVELQTSYAGTLFGLVPISASGLLAFGMRGSLFRSEDAGASWQRVPLSSLAGVTGGVLLPDGAIVLVTQAGGLEISRDDGKSFIPLKPERPMSYYGVAADAAGRLILAGAEGARIETVR